MTDAKKGPDGAANRFRSPPEEHRFKKGVSGNPKGRPRKVRPLVSTMVGDNLSMAPEDPLQSFAIEEAYRKITIRTGERAERIPVIQAIMRSIAATAAKGDFRAQKLLLEYVAVAETQRRAGHAAMLKAAVEYKDKWDAILAERARTGSTEPDPVPHPDEVIIDPNTGNVTIQGPVLLEQRQARDALVAKASEYIERFVEIEKSLAENPDDKLLLKERRQLESIFALIRAEREKSAIREEILRRPKAKKSRRSKTKPSSD